MFSDRGQILEEKFVNKLKSQQLPKYTPIESLERPLENHQYVELLHSQITSRLLDLEARKLKEQGQSFYTIGSSGHEGNAALGMVFAYTDMAFLHYRSGAFVIQRSKQRPGETPLYNLLLSFMAAKEDPISGGRHKVFGSKELFIPPQTSTIGSHLPKAVGTALSLAKTKKMGISSYMDIDSIIICSFGDASLNHSTSQGAINTAAWCAFQNIPMPILFVCEDNDIGISVPTPKHWVEENYSDRPGLKYLNCDGLNIEDVYSTALEAQRYIKRTKRPVFFHMKVTRPLGHAGSDIQSTYLSSHQIEEMENKDPLLYTASCIVERNILTPDEISNLYFTIKNQIQRITNEIRTRPKLTSIEEIAFPIIPPVESYLPAVEDIDAQDPKRKRCFHKQWTALDRPQHMAKLLNWTLTDIMLTYPNTVVFGEDVAKKGGVYHVTAQLQEHFGSARVFNTLLDEQAILGTAIGLAHNGILPIPEIQFLAYYHNAQDQIRGEAATLSFFSQGQFTNPMVLRIAGLAYQKGFGGHFHNDNSIAVFRDIPGIILIVPSNGADAVRLLRSAVKLAHEQRKIVVFLEPIALYMTKDLYEKNDQKWLFEYPSLSDYAPYLKVKSWSSNKTTHDLTIVTYGNGVYYSLQAAKKLATKHHVSAKVVDLMWLHPLPIDSLLEELKDDQKILIVDECRKSGSLSEELITIFYEAIYEQKKLQPSVMIKRHTAADCFIPLGQGAVSGLPSWESILHECLELYNR